MLRDETCLNGMLRTEATFNGDSPANLAGHSHGGTPSKVLRRRSGYAKVLKAFIAFRPLKECGYNPHTQHEGILMLP